MEVVKLIIAKPTREWTIRLPEIPKTEQRYFTPKEMQDIREFRKEMASKLG